MRSFKIAALLAASLLGLSQAYAAPVTDTRDASNGGPNTYFVPSTAQQSDSPYYRWYNEDWSWQHDAIASGFTTASLNISAYDIDFIDGEVDVISAWNGASWVALGHLAGSDNTWDFTTFNLDSSFFGEIATGLKVAIDIDSTHSSRMWAVTLAKSSLSVDGGWLPPPVPGIPEPETYAMMLAGLAAVGAIARRRRKQK